MKLSQTERLILSNQYAILAAVDPDHADEYKRMGEIFEKGYEWYYSDVSNLVYREMGVVTEEEGSEVVSILDMFRALQYAYDALDDKSGVDAPMLTFPGFDGNNETGQMAFARFMVEVDGKFEDLKRRPGFNSHMPSLYGYRAMLAIFNELPHKYGQLTAEQINTVLNAWSLANP